VLGPGDALRASLGRHAVAMWRIQPSGSGA